MQLAGTGVRGKRIVFKNIDVYALGMVCTYSKHAAHASSAQAWHVINMWTRLGMVCSHKSHFVPACPGEAEPVSSMWTRLQPGRRWAPSTEARLPGT